MNTNAFDKKRWLPWNWIVLELMSFISVLEFLTPSAFIFGYLYTVPILLASARLPRSRTIIITAIAVLFTLLNLWFPVLQVDISTIADRVIAALSLLAVGYLSDRNRYYQEAIVQQRSQLQASEKLMQLREDFTSTLTHDLKTPLLGAIETLNAFQQERFGVVLPEQALVIATMKHSHQTSLQLLETLLDIYRNDAEGLVLDLAPVDLITLIEQSMGELLDLATSRRVHLCFDDRAAGQSLWVNGDRLQIQRVLTNLLVNAINHSRRCDRVEILLESHPEHQVVKIIDGGSGLQREEFLHLFERFYQGQSDRQAKGTGLGLYLSRQIIEAHGGTIWAENRSPTGALFGFKLPISQSVPPFYDPANPTS
jgi:two-component system, NarL family, sensor kinase